MKTRFDGSNVPTKLLVDAVVGLIDCFVWIFYTAAAGDPCSDASAALPPAVEALAVEWEFLLIVIDFG